MKKILGTLLAFVLVISCVPLVPANAKDGSAEPRVEQGTQIAATSIDRTNWTGVVYDYNSEEEETQAPTVYPTYGDGGLAYMFDDEGNDTKFHTHYVDTAVDSAATLPIYMFIDLGQETTFGSFSWYNLDRNDAAKYYKMYINKTDESLIPTEADENGGYAGNVDSWTLVAESTDSEYLQKNTKNTVNLDELVTTQEILIVITDTHGTASTNPGNVTCKDFQLYSGFQNKLVGALDRTKWTGYAFDVNSREEHTNPSSDGPVANMFDGSTSTLFHTSYASNTTELPVYVFIDLGEASTFSAFSWQNRINNDAVKHYEMYINPTGDDLMSGLDSKTDGFGELPAGGWEKVRESSDTDYMKQNTVNKINLENTVTTKQILFKITETYEDKRYEDTAGIDSYVTCVEFNLYSGKFENLINMSGIEATVDLNCDVEMTYGTGNAGVDEVIDGDTSNGYLDVGSTDGTGTDDPGSPVYITIDMKDVYNISKVEIDVHDGRTYNNVVIVTSDTLDGFERANEHYVLFNTDSTNKTGYGNEKPVDTAQDNYITAYAQGFATGRYVRVYINGNTVNKMNHIYEILVYGSKNTDSVMTATEGFLLEGLYTDDTFNTTSDAEGAVTRYVTEDVLGVKAQAKLEENGTYTIRFVSSVASLSPDKVGFKIQKVDSEGNRIGLAKDISSTKVYGKVLQTVGGESIYVEPRTVFDNNASDYFFTLKVTGMPSDTDLGIKVQPYWYVNGTDTLVSGEWSQSYYISTFLD